MESVAGGQLITNQADLLPGDLVFFGGGSLTNFDHVGIYAGNGEMWDASDYNVPVQMHTLAWVEHALPFDGAVRYWKGGPSGGSSPAPNGSFVQVSGSPAIYRIVGKAAIHVDSCAALANCAGLQSIPSLSGYTATPANGSFVRIQDGSQAGWEGEVIGGALIHVDSCGSLNGCPGLVGLDSGGVADYIGAHPTPANGTFVRIQDGARAGWITEAIGGALIHVDSCGPLSGCPGVIGLDSGGAADYMSTHPTAANGAMVRIQDGPQAGWIGEAIGGAFIHIDSCAPLNGCPAVVGLDSGGQTDYATAHQVPENGSFVRIQDGGQTGWIGEAIGGALVHVDSCGPLAGCSGLIGLDSGGTADYIAAHRTPVNGTFVRVANGPKQGLIARAAGGALISITDCSPLNGCLGTVGLDSGGYGDYASAHPVPADGTVLLGVPSNATWKIAGGKRSTTASTASAVAVNDASLTSIPIASTRTPGGSGGSGCVVPRLWHMTLTAATRALRRDDCALGRVRRPRRVAHNRVLRITGQSARPGTTHASRYRIGIRLSALRR
jgi:hypothetical protein